LLRRERAVGRGANATNASGGAPSRYEKEDVVSVAKVVELTATSSESFEDAIRVGIQRSGETLRNIKGAWVSEQKVDVENGEIVAYRVALRITFVLE
jgi:flavin-binding protein dodecin